MHIIPAIDIKDGACVRLKQGRMHEATVFGANPTHFAMQWLHQGAKRLHIVDLDGAVQGKTVNAALVKTICAQAADSGFADIELQIGGGIRSLESIEQYLEAGARFVIIGTQAVKKPEFVQEACQKFPGHIIVGIDAKNGWVATEGWYEISTIRATDLAKQYARYGVAALIYTDISRDGMMQGVNLNAITELLQALQQTQHPVEVIASGGIANIEDIKQLLPLADQGLVGAITGRALYEGTLDIEAALECAGNPNVSA